MQEEFITTEDILEQTSASTCFNPLGKSVIKRLSLLAAFLCLYSGSFAFTFQDTIRRVEIKIILKEKAKQEINYDSLYRAGNTTSSIPDSGKPRSADNKNSISKKALTDSVESKEANRVLSKFKKEIDTQIATIQQKVLKEKTYKENGSKADSSIKDTIAEDRIAFIQIGFLIFIVGLFFGSRLHRVAFTISALGAILIVVALYI